MLNRGRFILAGLLAASWGCGDGVSDRPPDARPPVVDAPAADAPAVDAPAVDGPDAAGDDAMDLDASACPAPAAGELGGACAVAADCASGGFQGTCLKATPGDPFVWPEEGFCLHACSVDADCGDAGFCTGLSESQAQALGIVARGPAPTRFCFPKCCAGDTCPAGRICGDAVYGFLTLAQNACFPGDAAATDGDSCETFGDCNVSSDCRTGDIENPGGMCVTLGCTVGDDTTCAPGGDGHCIPDELPGQPFGLPTCVDTCDTDADCRTDEGYFCRDETAAGFGKFCWHAQIGDACADDGDCGGAPMFCDTTQPGGACTLACTPGENDCPDPDVCVDPGNGGQAYCADACDPATATACRPGYTCTAVNGKEACVPSP